MDFSAETYRIIKSTANKNIGVMMMIFKSKSLLGWGYCTEIADTEGFSEMNVSEFFCISLSFTVAYYLCIFSLVQNGPIKRKSRNFVAVA
jgi:hypothetical protein